METERTRDDNTDSPSEAGRGAGCTGCQIGCGMLLLGLFALVAPLFIPTHLPVVKDKAMIAYFREHRAEFEAVARRFRSFPDRAREAGVATPQDETETKIMLERAGLYASNPGWVDFWCTRWRQDCTLWLPDPYHPDSRRKAQELASSCRDEIKQWEAAKKASEQSAMDFEAAVPFPTCALWNGLRYGALAFVPTGKTWRVPNFRGTTVEKRYLHFPEAPEIVANTYLRPIYTNGRILWVTDSLNTFPLAEYTTEVSDRLRLYECRYRPIEGEPHWFLEMCISNNTPGYD